MARGKGTARRGVSAGRAGSQAAAQSAPALPDADIAEDAVVPAPAYLTSAQLASEDMADIERVIDLNHGGQITTGEGVGRFGPAGLDSVSAISEEGGTIVVRFASGAHAVVDLSNHVIQTDAQGHPSPELYAAIYAALSRSGDPRHADLAKAMDAYIADRSPASLIAAATAGAAALANSDGFRVVREDAAPDEAAERIARVRDLAAGDAAPFWMRRLARAGRSPIAAMIYPNREAAMAEAARFTQEDWDPSDMQQALTEHAVLLEDQGLADEAAALQGKVAEAGEDKDALEALAKEYPSEDEIGEPSPITVAVRRRTARTLGLPIYESNPHFHWDEGASEKGLMISDDLAVGTRAFGFSGPPGTGKNSLIYELAAVQRMPVFEVDFSAGDSMRDLIGDIGLEDGNTVLKMGPLARGLIAKGGVVAVYNEVVSARKDEQTALHNILGSGADQRRNRFITYKAPEGRGDTKMADRAISSLADAYARGEISIEEMEERSAELQKASDRQADSRRRTGSEAVRFELDPDSIQYLTWNPGRGDERPNEAVMRRMSNFTFEYGTVDQEAVKMAHVVYPLVREEMMWKADEIERGVPSEGIEPDPKKAAEIREAWSFDASRTETVTEDGEDVEREMAITDQCPKLGEECRTAARLAEHLRNMYMDDQAEHYMDTTTLARFIAGVIVNDSPNSVRLAARRLDFVLDQTLPQQERWDMMQNAMREYYGDRIAPPTGGINR